jgi:cytochrome c-type biogenesis protein CcmH
MRALLCTAILVAFASPAFAIDPGPAFDDPELQARYERLTRELRCLQCRSETIADSNASLAADLRRQLRDLIAAGKTDEEIFQYMTDRYGDYVLYKPPVKRRTLLLWMAPVLFLISGITAAAVVIARKSRLPEDDPSDPGLGDS